MKDRPKIVLLGASIVEKSFSVEYDGWGAGLADWYGRSVDIINRGFGGYNSKWLWQIVPSLFPRVDEDLLLTIICIGANDSSNGWQEVPIENFHENLCSIINYLQINVNPKMNIILITPPPVDVTKWPDRTEERCREYAKVVLDVGLEYRSSSSNDKGSILTLSLWNKTDLASQAHKHGLSHFDLPHFEAIEIEDLYDGLHPGKRGSAKILNNLQTLLIECLPTLVPSEVLQDFNEDSDGLPDHFPHFSDLVDKNDAELEKLLSAWSWN